jgi:UDP-glucuronate decarboxylase
LARKVLELTGASSSIVYRPAPEDDPTRRKPDITKAASVLGWAPTVPLDEGLERTIAWQSDLIDITQLPFDEADMEGATNA